MVVLQHRIGDYPANRCNGFEYGVNDDDASKNLVKNQTLWMKYWKFRLQNSHLHLLQNSATPDY